MTTLVFDVALALFPKCTTLYGRVASAAALYVAYEFTLWADTRWAILKYCKLTGWVPQKTRDGANNYHEFEKIKHVFMCIGSAYGMSVLIWRLWSDSWPSLFLL